MVTYFSGSLCDFWRNLMATVRAASLANHTVSYLLDEGAASCAARSPAAGEVIAAADVLEQPKSELEPAEGSADQQMRRGARNVVATGGHGNDDSGGWTAGAESANWGSRAFREVTTLKLRLVLAELARMPRTTSHLLYLDVDVVIMRNVLPELLALPPRDVYLQSDEAHFNTAGVKNFCTGVAWLARTEGTKALLHCALRRVTKSHDHKSAVYRGSKFKDDQDALNECVAARGGHEEGDSGATWDCGVLDPAQFPNGFRFFKRKSMCAREPALVHNNYAIGQRIKRRRFNKTGLWFV